ncbi:hypothetical protein N5K55_23575 [Pseudomonas aeruginosa]|nr:hypothetical protein [Pseudomonas aeruginosa]
MGCLRIGEAYGIATFAEMCSVTYDEAAQWAEDGTVPSIQMGCFRMINLVRFRDDMERGKATFGAGDYSHD